MNWYHLMTMMPITSPTYKKLCKQTLHSPAMVEMKCAHLVNTPLSSDYTGPPLILEYELEHSREDEFDGPYSTAAEGEAYARTSGGK